MSDIDVYIHILGKVKTHTCVRADTHNILYMHVCLQSCIPINMETYPQKQLLYCLIFVHMHVSFQAKEVNAPKGEEQVFFMTQLPAGTTLVEHEARFVLGSTAVLRNSREIKICLNAELPTH